MKHFSVMLPYPVSVNHYWRHVENCTLISLAGRQYRETVWAVVVGQSKPRVLPLRGRLKVVIDVIPPDRRKRDLDNILKSLLDAMEHAEVYMDDGQIDDLSIRRRAPEPGGKVYVLVNEIGELKSND